MNFDPRITPARGDLAASFLRGKVEAKNFADGVAATVSLGRASLHAGPSFGAGQASEVLFGESVTVYERREGWAWVQLARDGYVGYVREDCLRALFKPTHRVVALSTPLLPAPDVKWPALDLLPMAAEVQAAGREGRFLRIWPRGFVFADHLVPLAHKEPDWVSFAERFLGAPYVWGGKTYAGLDCSGLVQTALQAAGFSASRDSDMQEKALGTAIDLAEVRRGDLVFWKGHVGIMCDSARMLHANAHTMNVTIELLAEAVRRIAQSGSQVTSVRRLQLL